MTATILTIEDNLITRKMLGLALKSEGYHVLQASDGKSALQMFEASTPDLVLTDLLLPDMNGLNILKKIRALPKGANVPVIALTGFVSRDEEANALLSSFDCLLVKPIDPFELLQAIRSYLQGRARYKHDDDHFRILAVDDNAIQLKLCRIALEHQGFKVDTAQNALDGLEKARERRPELIISDVLMPEIDGFNFCRLVRNDSSLVEVPIILISSNYLEEEDRQLAKSFGASDLVVRTADFIALGDLIKSILRSKSAALVSGELKTGDPQQMRDQYVHRQIRQLERQARINTHLLQRCSLQGAALSVTVALANAVVQDQDISVAINEGLHQCLDAAGLSSGAIYLFDDARKMQLETQVGFGNPLQKILASLFKNESFLKRFMFAESTLCIPSPSLEESAPLRLIEHMATHSMLLIPIVSQKIVMGLFIIFSKGRDLSGEDWGNFGKSVALEIGQAIRLAQTFSRLADSEKRYRNLCQEKE